MSEETLEKPIYSFKEWINLLEERNVLLHEYRYSSDVDINNLGDSLTYAIFKGNGYIFSQEEYNHLKNNYPQLSDDIENSRLFYQYGLKNPEEVGVEAGILFASQILYDGDASNDKRALSILELSSCYDRKHETNTSPYKPSADADIILGNYHSTKDKSLALKYYNKSFEVKHSELPDNPKDEEVWAIKSFFTDSYINLLEKNEKDIKYGDPFLQELTNSIYEGEKREKRFVSGFLKIADLRLEAEGDSALKPETWIDINSTIINSYRGYYAETNKTVEGLNINDIWGRTEKVLEKGFISTDNAIDFIQKISSHGADGEPIGISIDLGATLIGNLYNLNRIDINKATETYKNISKTLKDNDNSIVIGYDNLLNTIYKKKSEKQEKFTDDEIRSISDYVASGLDGKIDGEKLAKTILHFDGKGYIDREYVKGKLKKEDLATYHKTTIDSRSSEPKEEVVESLLAYRKIDKKYVDDILAKDKTSLHEQVSQVLKDDKISIKDKKKILDDYSKTDVYNKLSDSQKSTLEKNRTELISQLINEEKEKSKVDTITAIQNLQKAGVLSNTEADKAKLEVLKSGEIPITDAEMEPIKVEVNGEEIIMDFTAAGWYDKILNFSFKNNKSGSKEIVDVVSEYGWMNNTTNKNTSSDFIKHNNIPYCYAVEYRQLYNASISNIILSFLGLAYSAKGAASGIYNLAGSVIDGIIKLSSPLVKMITGGSGDDNSNKSTTLPSQDGGQTTEEKNTSEGQDSWLDKAGRTINSWAIEGDKYFRSAMEKVAYLDSRGPIATGRKSGLLNPYRMMYILSKTDKQYCFPMLDKSASSYKVANKMDEADGGQGSSLLGNRFFGMVANLAQTVLGMAQDINQIAPFFQSAIGNADNIKSMRQYHIERSKFFSFPTDGEDIEVSFILFNTVKKNIWKKHFNFIFGFVLRNLPFKHDLVSYYPPLFYDVIVPGVKRCPYCYVERIDVSPLGLMRNMSMSSEDIGLPDLTNGGGKMNYTVNVPEAWQVKIVFKSLIATSGNQILSGFVDMPIQASSSNDSLKNKNENKKIT